jgi:outer membrane protein W
MTRSIRVGLGCLAAIAAPAAGRAQPAPDAARTLEQPRPPAPGATPATRRPSFYFRAGGAIVKPLSSSRELELADVDGPASLAVQNGPIAGSGATVSSATVFAGILGYVLPTPSRRWSVEAVVGLPFTVKFQATGTLANMSIAPTALGIPTGVGPLGPQLGEAKAAPGVATAVYQLTGVGMLRPYLGAGAAVLLALDPKVTNPTLTAVNQPEMTIAPAPGLVLQGGLDVRLWKAVYARLDVKFIALMQARAEVHHVEVKTPGLPLFDSVEVGTAKMNIWVNPLIVNLGVGFDFDL